MGQTITGNLHVTGNTTIDGTVSGTNTNWDSAYSKITNLNIINVKDYGAVGDGISDDTEAIKDAIGTGNVLVFIPDGTYLITEKIVVPSNTYFVGKKGLSIIEADSTFSVASSSNPDHCMFYFYGSDVNNKKENISFRNIHFKNTGNSITNFNAVTSFFANDIVIENCETEKMGLLNIRDINDTITNNSTSSYNDFTSENLLNQNIIVTDNKIDAYDGNNYADGIQLDFCTDFIVTNNIIKNSNYAIWWVGGAAIPANGGTMSNERKSRRGIVSNNSIENCMAGIFGHGGELTTVQGNIVDTADDVGIDFEGCRDITCDSNISRFAKNAPFSVFQHSKNVIFTNNISIQDGTTRGRGAGWQGVKLFMDSPSNSTDYNERFLVLKNNQFIYNGTNSVGYVYADKNVEEIIQNNKFYNAYLTSVSASARSFNCLNNEFFFDQIAASSFNVITSPTSVYASTAEAINIKGNKIYSRVTQPTNSVGIVCSNLTSSNLTKALIAENTILGFTESIHAKAGRSGGSLGTRYVLVKDNIVDGNIRNNIEITDNYSGNATYISSQGAVILDNNRTTNGKPYMTSIPIRDIWQKGQKVEFFDTSAAGAYTQAVCVTTGCAYKEAWSSGGTYVTGDFVLGLDSHVYRALADGGQAEDPTTDTDNTYWELYCNTPAVFVSYNPAITFSTDGALTNNSDTEFSSQKAIKTYADTKVAQTTTVNGHALSSNVIITATDVGAPTISSGSGAPSSTPAKIGNIYVDTTNHKLYFADGTSSSSNWVIAN